MVTPRVQVRVDNFICMHRTEPKRRFLVSDGLLYVALLLAVIASIILANVLSMRLDLPRAAVQIPLYLLLLVVGYLLYRHCLLAFRYTLTTRMLSIERIVGHKTRQEMQLLLEDIESIRPCRENRPVGKLDTMYTGRRRDAWALRLCIDDQRRTAIINPSEEFVGKLLEQWTSLKT